MTTWKRLQYNSYDWMWWNLWVEHYLNEPALNPYKHTQQSIVTLSYTYPTGNTNIQIILITIIWCCDESKMIVIISVEKNRILLFAPLSSLVRCNCYAQSQRMPKVRIRDRFYFGLQKSDEHFRIIYNFTPWYTCIHIRIACSFRFVCHLVTIFNDLNASNEEEE